MKNGLFFENDSLIYYRKGRPYHAGVVKVDGDIYYISRGGRAVKGQHVVHGEMANDILKRGTYTFGDDYKLVKNSYIPKKSSSKRSKSSNKSKKKMDKKKKKRLIILSAIMAVLLVAVMATGVFVQNYNNRNRNTESTIASVTLPDFDEEVLLCSPKAKKLYDNQITVIEAAKGGSAYCPLNFEYRIRDNDGELYISENADYSDSVKYTLPMEETFVTIDNLKTGTTYYYKVVVGEKTYEDSFKTAKSTRFVNIPGGYNTRDIGGYENLDGKMVKQGVLIRGSELDGLVEHTYYLKNSDVSKVQETFGFVYDMDLRESKVHVGEYIPRFGDNVGHKFYDAVSYGSIFSAEGSAIVKEIFSDMAKPENYPMYLHCTYGADRTGTMIFLLQGLLGMSQEDMIREYRTTAFFMLSFAESENMDIIIEGLKGYNGDTVGEKIENYMLSIGVTEKEIQSIRNIFLEN